MLEIKVNVNGVWKTGRARPGQTLLDFLRKELFCTEVKCGCERGDCGACTIILNRDTVNSCIVLALQSEGDFIMTSKGLGTREKMDPIQKSFYEIAGIQCGFCAPGMILSAKVLLEKNKNPDRDEIKRGLSGNLCRCTGYQKIIDAVEHAAQAMSEES